MEIRRPRLSLRPTQAGLLFSGILVAMLLGSINYNNNAGFILVFLLGTMALISLFHSYKNLVGLTLVPMDVRPVFLGESIIFPLRIKAGSALNSSQGNAGGLPQGQALMLGFEARPPRSFSLEEKKDTIHLETPSEQRGVQAPGNLILESVYPFGLFRLRAVLPFDGRGLVYPAPMAGHLDMARGGDGEDGEEKGRDSGPDDFQGLKPYLPGHPMGRISWKAFSRGQGMFIKDFTADTGQDLVFDMDRIRHQNTETKLSLICRAILDAEKRRIRYGIRLGRAGEIGPDLGMVHFHACLRALALYPGKGSLK